MKNFSLAAVALFLPLTSFAAATGDAGSVTCTGVNPHVNKVSFTLDVDNKGVVKSSMTYQSLTDDGSTVPPNTSDFDVRDIGDAILGYQHLAFTFGHHNTVVKVLADGDIFGGASENDNEKDPFQGVLFYQSGNGDASISRFQITCHQTN